MRYSIPIALLCLSLSTPPAVFGQGKRPLAHADYDSWNAISSPLLSNDGKLLAYGLFPQQGDGVVVVRQLPSRREFREAAGELPPPPRPEPDDPRPPQPHGVRLAFTRDGRFLVATTFPSRAAVDAARKARKKPGEMPRGGLLVIDTSSGAAVRVDNVKNMQVPAEGPALVAYLKEAPPAAEARETTPGEKKKEYGTDLVLRALDRPEGERTFAGVTEYAFAKDGRTLLYAVSSRNEEENGVYAVETASAAEPAALLHGKGKYSKLAWDRGQRRAAFLAARGGASAPHLYLWERGAASPAGVAAPDACREGYLLSEHATVSFSRDGSRLYAGCAPPQPPEPDTTAPAEGRVVADLWHWRDDFIQPMQKARAARERRRTYTAAFHLDGKRFVQLASRILPTVVPNDRGDHAVAADDRPYRRLVDYDGAYADHYLLDTLTGERGPAIGRLRTTLGGVQWSPDGRWVLFYRDRHWHTASVPGGVLTNLTSGIDAAFHNEDHDRPETPAAYGAAGWTSDSRHVLLYGRYDVWQVDPEGRAPRNLTEGHGRRNHIQFRVVRLEPPDERRLGIDPAQPVLLRAESLETRDTGFYRDRLDGDAPPVRLIWGAKNYRALSRAKAAGVIALTASTFHDFPDIHITDSSFARIEKATDANPQKSGLLWGSGELLSFRNTDGVPLQAALYKPENFDPKKQYPLLVYIYERLSQNLHNFVDPRPHTSINISYYVSNGYLVLTPDIVYTTGAPGQSALKCVLPAIQAVVDRGIVDENAIGIQGHSWGGYQVAYMVGHTRRFRAAEAGAPVSNMTSAYNGIRWGSGMPRQFQYEVSQSRIGGNLWERPLQYLENSPVFSAHKVRTPLLILHCDQDTAVPWYQGIELFLSLRRLGREAYLLNYNGEEHGLRLRQNQVDYTVRMQQFFDHFLKGAPAPRWMREGVPYLEREREKEQFTARVAVSSK